MYYPHDADRSPRFTRAFHQNILAEPSIGTVRSREIKSNGKFWIYFTVISVYVLLIGIIVLVLLVSPKSPSDWNKVAGFKNHSYHNTKMNALGNEFLGGNRRRPSTRKPFNPSPIDHNPNQQDYQIDPRSGRPRSDLDLDLEDTTVEDFQPEPVRLNSRAKSKGNDKLLFKYEW